MDTARGTEEAELEPVLISALEHYSYCPRQCGLIHLDQVWDENIYTTRGGLAHARVDEPEGTTEGMLRVERSVPLWSRRLGLIGRADVVEFQSPVEPRGTGTEPDPQGVPYPVEYKVGPRRRWGHDAIQVCAQGLCLEEMLGVPVPRGAIYYRGSRRRREVIFDEPLRQLVEATVQATRGLLLGGELPAAPNDARCRHCSLYDSCLPPLTGSAPRVRGFHQALFAPVPEPGDG